jgi:CBS domain-containing protein
MEEGRTLRHRKVSSVMTPADQVVSVRADSDYKHIAGLLNEHRISAVPVLDDEHRVVGVVSEADLLTKQTGKEPRRIPLTVGREERKDSLAKGATKTAASLMTAPAVTVGLNEDVVHAARIMEDRHIKRLPVTDTAGRLVGIVSRRDILRLFVQPDAAIREEIAEDVILGMLWMDPTDLEIAVIDGVVHLHGKVETRSMAELVGQVVGRTDGVVAVVNDLGWERDDSEDKLPGGRYHGIFERRQR